MRSARRSLQATIQTEMSAYSNQSVSPKFRYSEIHTSPYTPGLIAYPLAPRDPIWAFFTFSREVMFLRCPKERRSEGEERGRSEV